MNGGDALEFDLAGQKIRVRLDCDEDFGRRFRALFPLRKLRRPAPFDLEILWRGGRGSVRRRGRPAGRGDSPAILAVVAETAAISEALDRLRSSHILLHAAWVAAPGGSLLLAGAHGTGKTTLAAALSLRRRWKVLADDIVALDGRGTPRALERPLRFKPGCLEALPELKRLGLDLRPWGAGVPVLAPLRSLGGRGRRLLRAVVLLEERGSGRARLQRETGGAAFAALALHVSNLRERPGEGMRTLASVARRVPVWRLSGGSLGERLRSLAGLEGA